jgi:RNA polymerase sigma-70 factor (ECF subfamily)
MNAPLKPVAPETDDALLARVAQGDENALGTLYDRYAQPAFSLAHAIAGDAAMAEDAVADAFADLWRNATAAPTVSVRSRLFSRVRASALKMAKRTARPPRQTGPLRAAGSGSGRFTVQATQPLTATERRVMELAFFDGCTVRQIALQLEESESDVIRALRSAMTSLRHAETPRLSRRNEAEATRS